MIISRYLKPLLMLGVAAPTAAFANGLGEDRPYQFRTANERQVLLNLERTRLELQASFLRQALVLPQVWAPNRPVTLQP